MKNIKILLSETKEVENLEELESACNLFDYGVDKGSYGMRDVKEFNKVYWNKKKSLMGSKVAKELHTSKLKLIPIVSRFKGESFEELVEFVQSELKRIYNSNKGYKVVNKLA